ncbi:MAG: hypothetical protein FWE23_10165 [Chitinivibrionia bacterium]|nr:hypothetical protein [Chitinivibrionia bacterium]
MQRSKNTCVFRIIFLHSLFLLFFGCGNNSVQQYSRLSQVEIEARIEAARLADSLLNFSSIMEEERDLSGAFSGVHVHGLRGSGNLAFDAHQDPAATRRLLQSSAILAERYREMAPQVEEARRRMIASFNEARKEEERRLY